MRHSIEFADNPDGVIIHTFGRANVEGFRALNDALISHPRFRPGMQILVDHSHLDASQLTVTEIEEIGTHLLTLADLIGPSPIALIASDALTRLATQASADSVQSAALNPVIFETFAEGIVWLMHQERDG
jgi:hypothetical protein